MNFTSFPTGFSQRNGRFERKCSMPLCRIIGVLATAIVLFELPATAQSISDQDPVVFGMMQDFKIDAAEAKRRVAALQESVDLALRLEKEEAARFGGVYVENSPNFRIVVKLVGASENLLARYTQNPLIVAEKAEIPLTALRNRQEALAKALQDSGEPFLIAADPRLSKVVVTVKRGGRSRAKLEGQNLLTPDVTVQEVDRIFSKSSILGGRGIKSASYKTTLGETYNDSASLGFTVKHTSTNTKGILTAAHFDECDPGTRPDGTAIVLVSCTKNTTAKYAVDNTALTFKGQLFSSGYDVEWRTASDQTRFTNVITYGGGPYGYANMPITTVGTLSGNLPVCKQGDATYYTCGNVTVYATYNDPDTGMSGNFWLVKRNTTGAMAGSGDSGGPVFGGSGYAYGLNTAVVEGGTYAGQLVAMPIQRISGLGVVVMTTSN